LSNNNGTILKGVGGFYTVRDTKGSLFECRACGRFRKEGVVPLPGDYVEFSTDENGSGYIETLCPRRNALTRPRVANIDMVVIVASFKKPKPDLLLCDKLIVEAKRNSIIPLLVFNKCDVADENEILALRNEYGNVCEMLTVSALAGYGLNDLKEYLKERCTCFAGQSAVGKSSLLNALFPWLTLKTGGLSKKTDRGRHTTRHAEMLVLEDLCAMVVDTPGFSFLETGNLATEQLWHYYSDFAPHAESCRFVSCIHADEPTCGVKQAVESGLINKNRYQRYLTIINELKDRRSREYD